MIAVSDSKRCVTRIVWRQPLLPPFHEEYYASDNQTAYKRHREKHPSHGEHSDHEVEADIWRRVGRFTDVDNDRLFLQQSQEEHQSFKLCAPHVGASSASSTSVRTPTPVAPFG